MPHTMTWGPLGRLAAALALGLVVAGLVVPGAAGAAAAPAPPPLATALTLTAPASVVDERSVSLRATWTSTDGQPVASGTVSFQQLEGRRWRTVAQRRSDGSGLAQLAVTPRQDSSWRAVGAAGATWQAAVSAVRRIDNRPAGTPLSLPAAAPKPRALPAQQRATGAGAHPVVTRVPTAVWRSMRGRSWRPGCPVGRASLRLLRVNYWGFDGYRYRGEMVLHQAVAGRAGAALADMYAAELPVRRMYRVDRFGYSKRVNGADDHASMRADNSSGFNCRWVVNRPGVRSPHASGRAIDLNPWENPYHSATGWVPNGWWPGRSHARAAWRSAEHPVVRIWRSRGFRWTYGSADSQHVDGRQGPALQGGFVG